MEAGKGLQAGWVGVCTGSGPCAAAEPVRGRASAGGPGSRPPSPAVRGPAHLLHTGRPAGFQACPWASLGLFDETGLGFVPAPGLKVFL